jgi:peptide chain release factor 1
MYTKYAEKRRWKVEVMSESLTGGGGLKEIIAMVTGKAVYSRLKYESGVHRVQRVPTTESSGRIHTSAATVAILRMDDAGVKIEQNAHRHILRVRRAASASARPFRDKDNHSTGLVVSYQTSVQLKNKAKAWVLQAGCLTEDRRDGRRRSQGARARWAATAAADTHLQLRRTG